MAAADRAPAPFEVLDVLGGLTELRRASPTLDGSIPLRAAQACSPLLDGNRFGLEVTLTERLELVRSLTGAKLGGLPERVARALSGAAPRLFAEGLLDASGRWRKRLEKGLLTVERSAGRTRVSLFTGLLLRAAPGLWLRLSNGGNRRNLAFDVEERFIADDGEFAPLVVTLVLRPDARLPLPLYGELATLAPLPRRSTVERVGLAQDREIGTAHMAFFDQKYFGQKKRGPTRKYRRLVAKAPPGSGSLSGTLRAVEAGPSRLEVESPKCLLTARGIEAPKGKGAGPAALSFENALALSARFDGHGVWVTPDSRALEQFARKTLATWSGVFDERTLEEHRGALWYFTKYFTLHQAGEPYFFVKPPTLVRAPPGWSVLIDGVPGPGYSVLRGVVAADRFHATPAVIRLDHPHRNVELPAGAPLAKLFAFPRQLMQAEPERLEWRLAAKRVGAR